MRRWRIVCPLLCSLLSATVALGQPGDDGLAPFSKTGSSFKLSGSQAASVRPVLASSLFALSPQEGGDAHDDAHAHESAAYPEPFGFSLTEHWLDPWPHAHFSRSGTPFVHLFLTEPAFLDRDIFLDYRIINGQDEKEVELELEIEWAFTRRLGIVLELPYVFVSPLGHENDDPDEDSFGDFAVAPRLLLVDTERFMFSVNLEIEIPTGSKARGLSEGRVSLAPSVSWWYDFGHWVTWQGQTGVEFGLDSDDSELFWNTALTKSFLGPALFDAPSHDDAHGGRHFPPGLVNLIAEMTGRTQLSGPADGRSTAELLLGASYLLTSNWEIRAGFQFPIFEPRDSNNSVVFGLIYHF